MRRAGNGADVVPWIIAREFSVAALQSRNLGESGGWTALKVKLHFSPQFCSRQQALLGERVLLDCARKVPCPSLDGFCLRVEGIDSSLDVLVRPLDRPGADHKEEAKTVGRPLQVLLNRVVSGKAFRFFCFP